MAKFYGIIGIADYVEDGLDIYRETIVERPYSGDIIRKSNRFVAGQSVNDNLTINMQVSIVADPYINQHFPSIRYIVVNGCKWKVASVDSSNYPRLILTLGDVYNGQQTEAE